MVVSRFFSINSVLRETPMGGSLQLDVLRGSFKRIWDNDFMRENPID